MLSDSNNIIILDMNEFEIIYYKSITLNILKINILISYNINLLYLSIIEILNLPQTYVIINY